MPRPVRCLAIALAATALAAVEEGPPPGMNVIPLVKAAAEVLSPRASPVPGRPWSDDLAALTDREPSVNGPAVGRLVNRGAVVLPDLAVIASDRDWQVRTRVVRVAAGIGGEAGAALVLRLSADPDPRVRRIAIVGLGRCRGEAVRERLLELLAGRDPDERTEAAPALAALGDVRAIDHLVHLRADPDAPARAAAARALHELVRLPAGAPVAIRLLPVLTGEDRRALLEALAGATDPRLCPPLTALVEDREALTCLLAVQGLASAGDNRAVATLIRLATSERLAELREQAARTLQQLTGYRAGPGQAWTLWWQDHAARVAQLAERDALLAILADPAAPLPTGLASLPPEDLAPLVEAAIQAGRQLPPWVPARALAALRAQADGRWARLLTQRIDGESDPDRRLDLMLLLDEIGGNQARDAFLFLRERLTAREEEAVKIYEEKRIPPPDTVAERTLINQAIARQR